MTIKSATPSGPQRERAPGGWARVWPDNAAALLAVLTKPWPAEAMALDLDLWVDRVNHGGEAMPGRRCLASRWGVGERTARTVIDRWRDSSPVALYASGGPAPRPAEGPAEGPALSATMPMDTAPDLGNRPAEGPATRPAEGPASVPVLFGNMQPVGIVEAPQTADIQTADKNTSKPAKAGGVSLEDIQSMLDEMHAIAKAVDPKARLQSAEELAPAVMRTLKDLAPIAKSRKTTTRALIIDIWQWWWNGDNPWYRENRRAGVGYTTLFRPANARKYLTESKGWHAARYIPTADEALDAVIEVGSKEAGARFPAVAHVISEVFVQNMGAKLDKMRENPQQERMRTVWRTAYDARVSRPALALVAR